MAEFRLEFSKLLFQVIFALVPELTRLDLCGGLEMLVYADLQTELIDIP